MGANFELLENWKATGATAQFRGSKIDADIHFTAEKGSRCESNVHLTRRLKLCRVQGLFHVGD